MLQPTSKSRPHVQKKGGKKKIIFFANDGFRAPSHGQQATASRQPTFVLRLVVNDLLVPSSLPTCRQQPAVASQPQQRPSARHAMALLKIIFFGKFGEWARPFGRMGVQHPHFLKLAPTLGSVKSYIPQGDWRFHFFSIYEITKNSIKIVSVIEIFCTLL